MRRFPKLVASATGLLAALATFVAGGEVAIAVGKARNSGLLGICGPYGPHADLIGSLFLSSLPVGILVGTCVARRLCRHLNHNEKN